MRNLLHRTDQAAELNHVSATNQPGAAIQSAIQSGMTCSSCMTKDLWGSKDQLV